MLRACREGSGRGRPVAALFVPLTQREQDIDAAPTQETSPFLDLGGVSIEGTVVEQVAAVQRSCALKMVNGLGLGQPPIRP